MTKTNDCNIITERRRIWFVVSYNLARWTLFGGDILCIRTTYYYFYMFPYDSPRMSNLMFAFFCKSEQFGLWLLYGV